MKKSIISLLALFCLSSCCDNSPKKPELTPEEKTAESFKNPETIGTLPDGRVIQKVIYHPAAWVSNEIFIIGNSASFKIPNGKYKKPTAVLEGFDIK